MSNTVVNATGRKENPTIRPVLLNIRQLQIFLGLSRRECKQLLDSPGCPFAIRVGKTVYANRVVLERWIEENTGTMKGQ